MFLESLISPDFLKYGFIGFLAIYVILLYSMFVRLVRTGVNIKHWVYLFLVMSLFILTIGGFYVYSTDRVKYSDKNSFDSLLVINRSLREKLDLYNDSSEAKITLAKKIKERSKQLDSLSKINDMLADSISNKQQLIDEFISKNIADCFDIELYASISKSNSSIYKQYPKDINFIRLKRAVFNKFLCFHADKNLLKGGLESLINQHRGNFTKKDVDELLANYTDLMQIRLNWIKDDALPAFQKDFLYRLQTGEQRPVQAIVPLPKSLQVIVPRNPGEVFLDSKPSINDVLVTDIKTLQEEEKLLIKKLTGKTQTSQEIILHY